MSITAQTAERITADIKKFGDDVKALGEDTRKSLEEMRAVIDENEGKADAIADERISKFAAEVESKHNALENGIKDANAGIDEVKATIKRVAGGWGGEEASEEAKAAFDWHKAMLVADGKLFADTEIAPDMEEYAAYKKSMSGYIRAREGKMKGFEAALQTGSDPDGGYMVPMERSQRVITKVYETSPLRQFATVESIGGKELVMPRDEGEFGYGWIGERTAPSETTTSQFGESKIAAHEMYAEPRVTQTMLEDAGFDVEGWIGRKVGDKFGRVEAAAFISGDGVGKPRGILSYVAGTGDGQVEQVNSGAAAAVTADGVYDLVFSLKDYYTANARFLMKRTTVRDVLKLKDGEGQYMWQMGDIKAGVPATLLSYPVTRAEDMPTVEAGALAMAFGDFGEAYTIVDRLGITLLKDPYTAKPYVKFYHRRRVGGGTVNFEAYKIQKIAAA